MIRKNNASWADRSIARRQQLSDNQVIREKVRELKEKRGFNVRALVKKYPEDRAVIKLTRMLISSGTNHYIANEAAKEIYKEMVSPEKTVREIGTRRRNDFLDRNKNVIYKSVKKEVGQKMLGKKLKNSEIKYLVLYSDSFRKVAKSKKLDDVYRVAGEIADRLEKDGLKKNGAIVKKKGKGR
jgi:hypothetical protein